MIWIVILSIGNLTRYDSAEHENLILNLAVDMVSYNISQGLKETFEIHYNEHGNEIHSSSFNINTTFSK